MVAADVQSATPWLCLDLAQPCRPYRRKPADHSATVLRTCRDKRGLNVVVHQCIWKRSGYTATSNVGQPGSVPIFAWFLKVEDEEDAVIGILKSYAIVIEDSGGKLMRITRQIIEEHHRDLIAMGLHVI